MNPQGQKSAQWLLGLGGRPGETSRVMKTFWTQPGVVFARHCECAKCHETATLVKLMLCEFHLNELLFFKSNKNC